MSVVEETTLAPDAVAHIEAKMRAAQDELDKWGIIKEAAEQEKSPNRDRMVVRLGGSCLSNKFVATYRWEINWKNGWVTVQLEDGSILPTQFSNWCLFSYADDYFEIERTDIEIDDPGKGM